MLSFCYFQLFGNSFMIFVVRYIISQAVDCLLLHYYQLFGCHFPVVRLLLLSLFHFYYLLLFYYYFTFFRLWFSYIFFTFFRCWVIISLFSVAQLLFKFFSFVWYLCNNFYLFSYSLIIFGCSPISSLFSVVWLAFQYFHLLSYYFIFSVVLLFLLLFSVFILL